jgi:uncharacterized protein
MTGHAPPTTEFSEPFWEMARSGVLGLQVCAACGHHTFPARVTCPRCWSGELDWVVASGHGTLYSFTTLHRPPAPEFEADVPYTVALVDLAEGPRMMARLHGIAGEQVRCGMELMVDFEPGAEVPLPRFVAAS